MGLAQTTVVDDEPSVVEIGLVEVCPGDELRFRSADELSATVWLSNPHQVRVTVDGYQGRTREVDAGGDLTRVGVTGPCYDATLEAVPNPGAYDELVLSLPAEAERGGWVEIVDMQELSCISIALQPPETQTQ